ncbi:hypothetical protein M0804_002791 [Polistes exclamans]|nr:hypothetical protein M0804_002791 [Polistes exclamans]
MPIVLGRIPPKYLLKNHLWIGNSASRIEIRVCLQDCFSTQYFMSCIQALLLEDEKEKFQGMVEYLGRKK